MESNEIEEITEKLRQIIEFQKSEELKELEKSAINFKDEHLDELTKVSEITEKKERKTNSSEELKRIALELAEPIGLDDKSLFVDSIIERIDKLNKKQKRSEAKLMNAYYRRMK